jgi:hypothetical protein
VLGGIDYGCDQRSTDSGGHLCLVVADRDGRRGEGPAAGWRVPGQNEDERRDRSLWLIFLAADAVQLPVVVPIDDMPANPDPGTAGSICDVIAHVIRWHESRLWFCNWIERQIVAAPRLATNRPGSPGHEDFGSEVDIGHVILYVMIWVTHAVRASRGLGAASHASSRTPLARAKFLEVRRQAVTETLDVAVMVGGGPVRDVRRQALDAFDEFRA